MSKKGWITIAVGLVLAAVVAIGISAFMPPTPGVTYANYSRLAKGMTREQVDALLGKPNPEFLFIMPAPEHNPGNKHVAWGDPEGDIITASFDALGTLEGAFWNGNADERSGVRKLMDRIPWLARPAPGRMPVSQT